MLQAKGKGDDPPASHPSRALCREGRDAAPEPDDDAVRTGSATLLSTLIESVTIYPHGEDGPEAEVVAKVSDLLEFATNDNAAPRGGDRSSIVVVAGTGFEPVTFRL